MTFTFSVGERPAQKLSPGCPKRVATPEAVEGVGLKASKVDCHNVLFACSLPAKAHQSPSLSLGFGRSSPCHLAVLSLDETTLRQIIAAAC